VTVDLRDQFQRAFGTVRSSIEQFDEKQWLSGLSWFQKPARVAYHLVESLEVYFSTKEENEAFTYGRRFGASWWEMSDEQLPSREALLEYLGEVEARMESTFAALDDAALNAPFELHEWSGKTLNGHYVYALRHTMHHQGALTALATFHGHEGDTWA
jgi:hypothetical protein